MKSLKTTIAIIGLALAAGPITFGQSPATAEASAKLPEFEVVSLKPSSPNVGYLVGVQLTPDRLKMNFESVTGLICTAYNIPYWELSGIEPWMNSTAFDPKNHFDLEATLPQDLAPYNMRHSNYEIEDERIREMMQAMLANRFHLLFHRETKTGTVTVLEQSGKPLRLVPTKLKWAKSYGEGFSGDIGYARGISLYNTSMPQLARFLSGYVLHHTVIDKTGLDGGYDFRSATVITDEDFKSGDVTPLILPAINEMGLKLTQTKGPVEAFIIDRAEPPSAN